jgi:ribosomal protein S18 acetylase RimI-like enzyme
MSEVIINPSTEEERNWAAKLFSQSEPWITLGIDYEKCCKLCHDDDYMYYTAHINTQPCGMIILHKKGLAGSPYMKGIIVAKEHRSSGIGSALLKFAENLFKNDAKYFFLCVSSFNKRAQAFYEKSDYKKVGEFSDYIIEGESEILMCKRL